MFRNLFDKSDKMTIAPGLRMISLSAIALGAAFCWISAVERTVDGNSRRFISTY